MLKSKWQRRSAIFGGTVTGIAVQRGPSSQRTFAGTSLGLFISDDYGEQWQRVDLGSSIRPIRSISTSAEFNQDGTVVVATGDTVYLSEDAGETWHPRLTGSEFVAVEISPNFSNDRTVFAGTDGDGLYRSNDAGKTWRSANPGLLDQSVFAITLSPNFEIDRTGFVGTPSGVYQTRNGGQSWRELDTGILDLPVQCIAVSPRFEVDKTIFLGTESHGLLMTFDGGISWTPSDGEFGKSITAVAFSTAHEGEIAAAFGSDAGIYYSHGDGFEWREVASIKGTALALEFVSASDAGIALLAGLYENGVAELEVGAGSWTTKNTGLEARLLSSLTRLTSQADDNKLFATATDGALVKSTDRGHTWADHIELERLGPVVALSGTGDEGPMDCLAVGTLHGIACLDPSSLGTELRVRTDDPVIAVAAHRSGVADSGEWICGITASGTFVGSGCGQEVKSTIEGVSTQVEHASLILSPEFANARLVVAALTIRNHESNTGYRTSLWHSTDAGGEWARLLSVPDSSVCSLTRIQSDRVDDMIIAATERRIYRFPVRAFNRESDDLAALTTSTDIPAGFGTVTDLISVRRREGHPVLVGTTTRGAIISFDGGESFERWSDGIGERRLVSICDFSTPERGVEVIAVELGGAIWACPVVG